MNPTELIALAGWTERHASVTRLALWRFISDALARAKFAALRHSREPVENVTKFHDDAKAAEEVLAMLAAAPTTAQTELSRALDRLKRIRALASNDHSALAAAIRVLCDEVCCAHPAPAAPQAEPETFESELRSFAETPEQVAFVEKLIAPQAEQKREPHWIDPVFSEWWSSDKADEHADNPFQADSAAAWAYAGWMAAQRAEPKRPQIEVSLAAGLGYWGVALCVGAQSFALLAEFATLTEAEEYAERLRAALGITGDSDAD